MTNTITKLLDGLGFWGSIGVVIIVLVIVALTGFKIGKFEVNGLLHHFIKEKLSPMTQEDFKYELEIDKENKIGFEIPRPNVKIYGRLWNKEHTVVYRLLEDKWNYCKVVDLTECNITSSLISLLEDKAQKFDGLTIYLTHDQVKLVAYLEQYQNIKLEIR